MSAQQNLHCPLLLGDLPIIKKKVQKSPLVSLAASSTEKLGISFAETPYLLFQYLMVIVTSY
jgi:hypothetical protein